jgi:hypothetical protein
MVTFDLRDFPSPSGAQRVDIEVWAMSPFTDGTL